MKSMMQFVGDRTMAFIVLLYRAPSPEGLQESIVPNIC